ncbi:MAG: NAD(P)/FAD-dependent oxidoreductase [Dehalococcoidia bacterium]
MDSYRYVILGGGMVAGYAAQEMAAHGLAPGDLAIVSSDSVPPYERPPLSKGLLRGDEDEADVFINNETFYRDRGISLRLSTAVDRLDTDGRRLRLGDGSEIEFGQLVIATGARVRTLDVPGAALEGVCYLRSLDDSKAIRARAERGRRAVVLGGGFIGMEVAAVLAQRGLDVTLVFPEERVWERFFTPEMSGFFERYYGGRGVALARQEHVARVVGDERVQAVELESGRSLQADLVVAGIGVVPVVDPLEGSGIALDDGVVVDEYLESSVPGIFAAGDVANYRDLLFGTRRRLEHWDNAVEQGKHVGRALLGERTPFVHVPYFFSDVFDLSYELWGAADGADAVVTRGDVASGSFGVWWSRGDRVVAAFLMDRPDEERDLAPALISDSKPLPPSWHP